MPPVMLHAVHVYMHVHVHVHAHPIYSHNHLLYLSVCDNNVVYDKLNKTGDDNDCNNWREM